VSAERAEREVLQQEADATAAAHRQAFDDMVAAARAAPTAAAGPPDPMRFRALPPGARAGLVYVWGGGGCCVPPQKVVAPLVEAVADRWKTAGQDRADRSRPSIAPGQPTQ